MTRSTQVVGPRLRRLLLALFFIFACLAINSVYLGTVTFVEWFSNRSIQNLFYQSMFLVHLVLGLLIMMPTLVYGLIHYRNARTHRNKRAIKAGVALFSTAILIFISGLLLTRGLPWFEIKSPTIRNFAYWLHIATPFVLTWLYILHRLAGRNIRWRTGVVVLSVSLIASLGVSLLQFNAKQPATAQTETDFFPSLAKTDDGKLIPPEQLMQDEYCQECHQDTHDAWANSMHRFSSFNNPAYGFSVKKTREFLAERDDDISAIRFCAGCHDPVPLFSGAINDPQFGNQEEAIASAGITCTACHAITSIDSTRGNADYTITTPQHYLFKTSTRPSLQWLNRMLIKAKPAFHKQTFLKPLHTTAEFCSTCHKVHLPEALNKYRWLRGQNHYDSFLLSGVSGHSPQSFYYPSKAQENCNECHMPWSPSNDFGAKLIGDTNSNSQQLNVHDHQFAAANTAIPHMLGLPPSVNIKQKQALQNIVRVDIFGIRDAGKIDGQLRAPLHSNRRIDNPISLQPGKQYLLEVVIRTLKLGHHFTQGTSDSNQIWLELIAKSDGKSIGQSGALIIPNNEVDPQSHFVNSYVIDRYGQRIDRRNPENIFTQLYNNQIPPGASDVVHYLLDVPANQRADIDVAITLNYRKFDTTFLKHIQTDKFKGNDLPITAMATDTVTFTIASEEAYNDNSAKNILTKETLTENASTKNTAFTVPLWERWNDYGIGLLRRSQFRQAEEAFKIVEGFGHGAGAVNLARIYLKEGRLDKAASALTRATVADNPAPPWTVSFFTAHLNLQNGFFDEAITGFRDLINTNYPSARQRGFDFSKDYRLLNDLGLALAQRAKLERDKAGQAKALQFRLEAIEWYKKVLTLDAENVQAHYGLAQLYEQLSKSNDARHHRRLHAKYKIDDNAKDRAIQRARQRDPAADKAANKVVIYPLTEPHT